MNDARGSATPWTVGLKLHKLSNLTLAALGVAEVVLRDELVSLFLIIFWKDH